MVPNTRARDALESKLADLKVVDVARRLSVGRLVIYAWLRRRQRPEPEYRLALERELGIPSVDWLSDDERAVAFGPADPDPKAA